MARSTQWCSGWHTTRTSLTAVIIVTSMGSTLSTMLQNSISQESWNFYAMMEKQVEITATVHVHDYNSGIEWEIFMKDCKVRGFQLSWIACHDSLKLHEALITFTHALYTHNMKCSGIWDLTSMLKIEHYMAPLAIIPRNYCSAITILKLKLAANL